MLKKAAFEFGNVIPDDQLLARPWLYEPFVLRGQVTTIEPTGAWGGELALQVAIHGSLGLPFRGREACVGSFKTVFFDWDADRKDLPWRVRGICKHFGFDPKESRRNIEFIDLHESTCRKMIVGPWTDEAFIDELAAAVASVGNVGMLAMGPLNPLTSLESCALKDIARKADVALLAYYVPDVSNPSGSFDDLYFSNSLIEEYGLSFWGVF